MKKITVKIEANLIDGGITPRGLRCENYFDNIPDDIRIMLSQNVGAVSNLMQFLEPGQYVISVTFEKKKHA